jgi:uncharacterized protein with HEPN domain
VSRRDDDRRLADVEAAINAIDRHLKRGTIEDELVFDACRARLIEIGEAVKAIDPELLAQMPDVPWRETARMRDHLTHRYFDTQREIVADVVTTDLPSLRQAVSGCAGSSQTTKQARPRWASTTRPAAPNELAQHDSRQRYRPLGPVAREHGYPSNGIRADVRASIGVLFGDSRTPQDADWRTPVHRQCS